MPHQCTECGHAFPDGSKEMLGGCPDCGGNKFQFLPEGAAPEDFDDEEPPERSGLSGAASSAAETVRDVFGGDVAPETADRSGAGEAEVDASAESDAATGSAGDAGQAAGESGDDDIIEAPPEPAGLVEDPAQADARSAVVDANTLPEDAPDDTDPVDADAPRADVEAPREGNVVGTPSEETPDMDQLREELNDQFESIRIVEPGQYELNLMELYDREEYIIALQENGRYVIEVPDAWRDDED